MQKKANYSLAAALWMVNYIRSKCSIASVQCALISRTEGATAHDLLQLAQMASVPQRRRTTGKSGGPAPRPSRNKFRGFSLLVLSQPRRNNNGFNFESLTILTIRAHHPKQNITGRPTSIQPTTSPKGFRDSSEWVQSTSIVVDQTQLFTDTCSHYQEKQLSVSASA